MSMPLPFALKVQRLHRQGLTVPAIARIMSAPVDAVMEAHRWLSMPVNLEPEAPAPARSAAEFEAKIAGMPQRMQDRIRRSQQ